MLWTHAELTTSALALWSEVVFPVFDFEMTCSHKFVHQLRSLELEALAELGRRELCGRLINFCFF